MEQGVDQSAYLRSQDNHNFKTHREIEVNSVLDLNRLRAIAEQVDLDRAVIQLIDNALERSKAHKFSIAVVGEFKRGKSTFINALLGKDVLPSDVLPCSATLNRVTYGLQPKVQVVRRGQQGGPEIIEEIGLDQLADYVTKLTPEAEQIAATVKEAIVYYPLAYCQNNVEIVDTPGLNDDSNMTQVTLSVLPDVSAAILVIMATSPFSQYEADFLTNQLLLQDLGRVIFVVTAIDLIRRPDDRDRITKTIEDRIRTAVEKRLIAQFGSADNPDYQLYRRQIGPPLIFPLSGYMALEAKETNNESLLQESGFPRFERQLEKFITETRGVIELQVLANRIISGSDEILKKVAMEIGALQMKQEEFDRAYQSSISELDNLRTRRDQELRQINEASHRTKVRILPFLDQMGATIRQETERAIIDAEVKPADLSKPTFREDMDQRVMQVIQVTSRRGGERIQIEIERDLGEELRRLGSYTAEVSQVLEGIEMKFVATAEQRKQPKGEAVALVIGGLFNSVAGGILAGYQEAGGKGAAVGGAVGLGTLVAGSVFLAAVGVSGGLVLPAVIALGLGGTIASKFAARAIFAQDQVDRFKREYATTILQELDKQIQPRNLSVEINTKIDAAYATLIERVIGELDTTIEQTRSTLDQMRSQKARQESLGDHRRKEYESLRGETQKIRDRAQTLSNYLVEITSV